MENRFTQLAKEVRRYKVKNGNDPNPGNVTEEKQSELDEVVANTITIIGILGYRLFVPMIQNNIEVQQDDAQQFLNLKRRSKKSQRELSAKCKQTSEGFVVLKGSMVDEIDSSTIPGSIKELRNELKQSGIIKDGILLENQLFNSPSYASAFVLGMSTNGRMDWKDSSGRTLKEIADLL